MFLRKTEWHTCFSGNQGVILLPSETEVAYLYRQEPGHYACLKKVNMRIIVAGGGASGLMAALAAKQSGAEEVLILERGGEIGKKILSTGSGRCNLTNENQSPDCYHSSLQESFLPVLSQFSKEDTIRFFEENGLHLKAKNGYYYPRNAQALSVRDFLRDCCRKAGVRVELNKKITGVTVTGGKQDGIIAGVTVAGRKRDRNDIGVTVSGGKQNANVTGVEVTGRNFDSKKSFAVRNREKCPAKHMEVVQKAEMKEEKSEAVRFQVICEDGSVYTCDRLILAGGGKAAPKTGSDGSMFAIAARLGHKVILPVPALTPLCVKKEELKFFKTADGTRADGKITLLFGKEKKNGTRSDTKGKFKGIHDDSQNMEDETSADEVISARTETITDCGEIQFVDYGLSGIPAFNVSAAAGRAIAAGRCVPVVDRSVTAVGEKSVRAESENCHVMASDREALVSAEVDFLPEISSEILKQQFDDYRERFPEDTFRMWLRGYLPTKLAEAVLALVGIPPALYLRKCTDAEAERLVKALKGSSFALAGTGTFEKAQTTSGGIDMREIQPDTLESRLVPGLYFAGEILDVDGICGGYNLQWAWSSGYVAGRAAVGKTSENVKEKRSKPSGESFRKDG